MSLFKTKVYSKPELVKTLYAGGKKQSKENIIKSIRNLKNYKNYKNYKKVNEAIQDSIIRDIRTLLEQEKKGYHKPIRVRNFWNNNILNMKAVAIEIKTYQ